jgi:hypothetical protein
VLRVESITLINEDVASGPFFIKCFMLSDDRSSTHRVQLALRL